MAFKFSLPKLPDAPTQPKPLPLIGDLAVSMQVQILAAAFLLFLVAATFVGLMDNRAASQGAAQLSAAAEMRSLGQQMARAAQSALGTQPEAAFAALRSGRERYAQLLGLLAGGGTHKGVVLAPIAASLQTPLEDLRVRWDAADRNAQAVLTRGKPLAALARTVAEVNAQAPRAADLAAQAGGSLPLLVERIGRNANLLLGLTTVDPVPAQQLTRDLAAAAEAAAKQAELAALLKSWQTDLQAAVADLKPLLQAKQAAGALARSGDGLGAVADALIAGIEEGLGPRANHLGIVATFGSLSLAMLVLMVKVINDDALLRQAEAERQRRAAEAANHATQQAVQRLVDEMATLADGDLSVRATLGDDLTGDIAEAMNYAIDELSVLVRRINDAAGRVAGASRVAAETTDELLAASDTQSDQIRGASGQVLSMAQSMHQVSDRARESAAVARQSLEAAGKGAQAVENSIAGMNDIRGQIQETSKRIKRLGESSQEIGEIVELISDITEQTNVLALNAAIQAASAGEAGRGFSVVAEEVQRLAERSAEATKQIAALVRTIQTDTHEAVAAMERSTQNVVQGARLSDATGQALAEISRVSRDLATLIEGISGDTQRQAETAARVAEAMKEILRITERTSEGTQQTAISIGELAELAVELKGSVAGFKV
ncbi:MAG: methyl-accepting chemotaxis protein [Rhodocyclaceae bacterium]|nr:methyl-accepting chemotaxis protein [Rhodocyclaceae bacterium]